MRIHEEASWIYAAGTDGEGEIKTGFFMYHRGKFRDLKLSSHILHSQK